MVGGRHLGIMKEVKKTAQLTRILQCGVILILVSMPFHALLTTWIGSNVGNLLVWRAWKEVLLMLLAAGGLYLFFSDKALREKIWSRLVNKLIALYAAWLIFVSLLLSRDVDALAQGLAINLRFLLFFVLVQIVFYYRPIKRDLLFKIILIPSVFVVTFGLMQLFLLPRDFLQWFGYHKYTTIPPFFTVDEQLSNLRYMSFLSGPNTLGAYLVLPILLVVGSWKLAVGKKQLEVGSWKLEVGKKKRLLFAFCFLLSASIVLYGTHSRSAWIAACVSLAVFGFFKISKNYRYFALGIVGAALILATAATYQYRQTQFVQDVILHDDQQEGGEVSSNKARFASYQSALQDIKQRPLLGCGVGCAGPASVRNENGVKIAENYYLQVGQEAGIIAVTLFLTIIFLVAKELYKKREDSLHLALLASLIGLSVANLLLHTWADDTLAYLWWGTAAVVLFSLQNHSGSVAASAKHPRTSA